MGTKVKYLIWILPVILAVFARFSFAAFSPPSVNWDEAAFGYNAYSLLLSMVINCLWPLDHLTNINRLYMFTFRCRL